MGKSYRFKDGDDNYDYKNQKKQDNFRRKKRIEKSEKHFVESNNEIIEESNE